MRCDAFFRAAITLVEKSDGQINHYNILCPVLRQRRVLRTHCNKSMKGRGLYCEFGMVGKQY